MKVGQNPKNIIFLRFKITGVRKDKNLKNINKKITKKTHKTLEIFLETIKRINLVHLFSRFQLNDQSNATN
jgi:hypothetical protein